MDNKRDYIEKIIEWILFILAIVVLLVANIAVVSRFLKIPLSWSDELLRALFVAMFFIGSAIELKTKGLISITVLEEVLGKMKNQMAYTVIKSFQYLVTAAFTFFSAYYGIIVAISNFQLDKRTAVMRLPSGYIMITFVTGLVLVGSYSIYLMIKLVREKHKPTV